MLDTLRTLLLTSTESLNGIATKAGIAQPVLWRFAKANRSMSMANVEKLINYFKLELKPRRGRCGRSVVSDRG